MSGERRKFRRSDSFLIVEFKTSKSSTDYSTGITNNYSRDGFSFESQGSDLQQGETLEFKLKHPYRDLSVSVSGKIVRVREGWYKYIAGIRFGEMDKETERRLMELIAAGEEKTEDSFIVKKNDKNVLKKEERTGPAVELSHGQVDEAISGALNKKDEEIYIEEAGNNKPGNTEYTIKDRTKKVLMYISILAVIAVSCAVVMLMMFEDPAEVGNMPVYTYTGPVYDKNVDEKQPAVISENRGGDDLTSGELPQSGQTQTTMEESGKLPGRQGKPVLKQVFEKPASNRAPGAVNKNLVFDPAEVKNLTAEKVVELARQKEKPEKIDALPSKKKGMLSAESVQAGKSTAQVISETGKRQRRLQMLQSEKEMVPGTSSDRQNKKLPKIALIVTNTMPSLPDGNMAPGGDENKKTEKWEIIGKTKNGTSVYINFNSISSRSGHIIKVPVQTAGIGGKSLTVLEMDCLKARYRIIDESSGKVPVSSSRSDAWQSVSPRSVPGLVYNAVCFGKE